MVRGGFNNNPKYLAIRDNYKNFAHWVLKGLAPSHLNISHTQPYHQHGCGWKDPILPQHYWLLDEEDQLILPEENIGRFENLVPEVQRILGIDLLYHYNASPNKRPWHTYYSNPAVADKVYKLYERDFTLFNYSKEIPN